MNASGLQTTFYIIGIIYMTLQVLLFVIIVVLLFYIKNKVTNIVTIVEERIDMIRNIVKHPGDIATSVGTAVATTAIDKVSDLFRSKRKKE